MSDSAAQSRELDEPVLEDSYPVYGDYLYVADGKVIRSDVFGNVRDLKRALKAAEIRRCDMYGRAALAKSEGAAR